MALLGRVLQRIFAETGTNESSQFGSEAAGASLKTQDIDVIQQLAQYSQGWFSATSGAAQPPRIEDMNGLQLMITTQLKYLFQNGIPEWLSTEDYYQDISFVSESGNIYVSLTGSGGSPNTGNQPSLSPSDWRLVVSKLGQVPAIGEQRIQFPGKQAPGTIYPTTVWTDISSIMAGEFMRIAGGNALAFGGGSQADAMRNLTGDWTVRTQNPSLTLATGASGISGTNTTGTTLGSMASAAVQAGQIMDIDASRQVNTGPEFIPPNKTIIIWERTA